MKTHGEYGFDYDGITHSLKSNNKNVPNSTAYGTLKLDLTNKQGICNVIVNAEISSNSYNYGYAIVRNTSDPVSYSGGVQDGQILKITDTVTDGYYSLSLAGGQVYYLQLGYYKNGDRNTGTDTFTVKNVWVQEKNEGELTLTSGTIDIVKNASNSSRYNCGILNTGILKINGATITSTSTGNYKNGVLNDKAGITVMNSGNITGNLQGIGNVSFNNSKEIGKVVVNGGTISTNYDGIDSNAFIGNVIINDGVFNSSSYQVYTTNRSNVVINGGTFGSDSNNSRLIYINSSNSVVEVNGGTFNSKSYCFYYYQAGKVVINNGTIQSNGTSTIYLSSNGIVEINGGNIKSINANVIENRYYTNNTQTKGAQIKITGGTLISESTNSNYYGVIWSYTEPNNIKITGGNLQSFGSTVYMVDYGESYSTKGTLEITGGNIESVYKSSVYVAAKNIELITIGTKDGNINKDEPKLKGAVNAIYSPRANVNFYDGQLIAPQNQVISGQVNEIEENTELVSEIMEDNLEKITLGEPEPVAKIGENTYSTLQQAINSCSTEAGDNVTTIEILRDFNMANQAVISEGQNIKIDLNNKNMYVYSANSAILNNGKLEITDTPNIYNNTYNSLVNNGTYYFENIENIFTSNNNGIANSTASSYVEIDLTNKPVAEYTLTVNAEISSETDCDIGFATVKEKLETPNYSDTTGRFIYISGEIVAKDYTTVLQGGKKYYLYLGYRKDGNKDTGNDVFKINSININGGITGVINSTGATILSNNSNATISDINMKFSATGSNYKWLNNIVNSGNLVINSGGIVTNGKYTRGIYNTGVLNINGGLIDNGNNSNTRCIQNNDEGSVNIANGVIKSNYNSNTGIDVYNIYNNSTNDIVIGDTNQQNNPEITLNGGTGIYNNNSGNIIINSGKIVSANGFGIQNKSTGNINVKNATIDTYRYSIQEDGDSNIIVENSNITSRYGNSVGTAIYLSKGNLEIKSGSINGYYGIFVNFSDSSEVTINEGTVTGRDYGIYANYGKVTIYNCNISGTNGTGIYLGYSSIVQLGEKDGTVSTTIPSVYGKEKGVNIASSSASFNFYDGIIEGKEGNSITGTVNDKETGYEVKKTVENSRETAVLEEQFIAEVESTGTTYKNIQDAVDNTQNTDKITIINSTSLGNTIESIKIPAEKEIKLDLAGFTIEAINNTTFENKGKFTIMDSSEQKTGNIYGSGANGIILNTENGNLNLESGTLKIKSSGKAVYNTGSGTVTVNGGNISSTESGYGIFNESTGDVNIQSGNISLTGNYATTRAVYNNGNGKINITGGYIYAASAGSNYAKTIENIKGTIDVSGGEIKGEDTITNSSTGIVKVSNGTITSTGWNADAIKNNGGNVEVTGGTLINTNQGTGYTGSVIRTDGGTLNITGGTLTGGEGIETWDDAVVNITGGEIYAKGGAGIHGYRNGNITFENAKIESYGNGILSDQKSGTNVIVRSGTITSSNSSAINILENYNVNVIIGEENLVNSPNITGASGYYAVWCPNGSISFYNGTITGGTIVCGAFDNIPSEKEVILTQNENTETAVLGDIQDVVKIGEKTYKTLQSAIDECEENTETTIIVNKNFVISRSVEIPSNKKVILDLNGNTIRTYARNYSILNNGTLNIVDNTENKIGAIIDRGAKCIIKNTGILNIQEGNFKMHQGFSQKMIYNTENGSVNINGGDFYIYESSGSYSNRCYSYVIYSDGTGNINVQGGTIRLNKYDEYTNMYGIYNVSSQVNTVTFNNATIQNEKSGVAYTYGICNKNDANVNILGGKISMYNGNSGENTSGNYCVYMEKGTLSATGGTISGGTGVYNRGTATLENVSISSITGVGDNTGTININNGTTISCGSRAIDYNSGTINIYGGIIKSSDSMAIHNSNGNGIVNIYDGTIKSSSTSNATIYNIGTVNITGGTVESTSTSAIQNVGTLTIGDNQYPVSKESPVITGATYGVGNSGTFNYYDGIITGKTKAISGSVTNIPQLYKVVYSENDTVATLDIDAQFEQVASVNGIYYDTLQSAINAASSNGKVILHKNIVLTSQATIEQSANVTINLATYSISYTGENSAIVNNGNLTIINYNEEEQKEIEDADITIPAEVKNLNGVAITNNGTLTIGIDNGTVSKLSPAITGTPTAITNNGTLNLYDGTLNGEEITPGTQTAEANLYKLAKAEIMKAPAQVLAGKEVNYISVPSITQNPTEWTNQDVTVTIENTNRLILNIKNREKGFDLALRKYITSVDGKEPTTSRNPVIDEYALQGIKETGTAYYKHTKEALIVQTGNIVIYRMSIYNEGEISGYATEITDYLPAGLEYIADNELNQRYGWQVATVDETTGKATSIKTNYLQNTSIQADENSNTITKIINNELTEAPYVEVACKVTAVGNTTSTTKDYITNRAEITVYGYNNESDEWIEASSEFNAETNNKVDKDSVEKTIETNDLRLSTWYVNNVVNYKPQIENYYPGEQDDDDFETVYVEECVEKTVTKQWENSIYDEEKLQVILGLYKNDDLYKQYTLTKEDNWTYTFGNLPKYNENNEENQYSIKELQVLYNGEDITSKFTTTYNGDVIKNIEKVDIPVTKTWNVDDPNNYSVIFELLKDGAETQIYSTEIIGNGNYTFSNLEKYSNGKQVVYTVKEYKVKHYNGTEWKDVSLDKFTTENTNNNFVNTPKLTISISKSKQWSNLPDGDSTVIIKNTKQSRVIVHYYKKGTGPEYNNSPVVIKEDEVVYVSKGGTYTTTPSITIGDYELTKDETGNYIIPENASGVYTEDEINVYYYYE